MNIATWFKDLPHRIRNFFISMVAVIVPVATAAQTPPDDKRPPAPPQDEVSDIVKGKVVQYLMNPRGEVDGMLLENGIQIHFPPHLSDTLTETIKPSDGIKAEGVQENDVHFRALTITNISNGRTITDTPPSYRRRPLPPELAGQTFSPMEVSGTIKATLLTPRGDINGVIMQDGTMVHFPPDLGNQMGKALHAGEPLAAKGLGVENQFGRSFLATDIGASKDNMKPIYDQSVIRKLQKPGSSISR